MGAGVLQIITLILIARFYGAEINGVYSIAILLPTTLAALLNFGIAPANVYFLGTRKVTYQVAIKASMRLSAGAIIIGLFLGSLSIQNFSDKLFPGVPESTLWLAVAAFPFILMLNVISSIFQGLQRFREYNFLALIAPLITLVVVFLMILGEERNINDLLSAYLVGLTIALLIGFFFVCKINIDCLVVESGNYAFDILKYGYKAHVSNLMSFFNYKIDLFLVNFLIGPVAAGVYVVAVQLVERLWLLAQAVSVVLLPRLSELEGREDLRAEITPLISRWVFSLTAVASVVLAAFGFPLLRYVFGEEFIFAYPPLLYLLPGIVAGALSKVLASDIAARGKPELNMYTTLISLPLNILGNVILIPVMGLSGAALATTFTYFVILVVILIMYNKVVGVSPRSVLFLTKSDILRICSRER